MHVKITQSLNINDILGNILSQILDLFKRTDRGFIILIDDETGEILKEISIIKRVTDEDTVTRYSQTLVDRVCREKEPVIILDTQVEDWSKR